MLHALTDTPESIVDWVIKATERQFRPDFKASRLQAEIEAFQDFAKEILIIEEKSVKTLAQSPRVILLLLAFLERAQSPVNHIRRVPYISLLFGAIVIATRVCSIHTLEDYKRSEPVFRS
jgi:hypothetical protein